MKQLAFLLFINIALSACIWQSADQTSESSIKNNSNMSEDTSDSPILSTTDSIAQQPTLSKEAQIHLVAQKILTSLSKKDLKNLAQYVDPKKGVFFEPNTTISPESMNNHFSAEELSNIAINKFHKTWGTEDGSGESMQYNFHDFLQKVVYHKNFVKAPKISINRSLFQGNNIDNTSTIFPDKDFIDFHIPSNDSNPDWATLRLIFNKRDSQYFLMAIINNRRGM